MNAEGGTSTVIVRFRTLAGMSVMLVLLALLTVSSADSRRDLRMRSMSLS